MGEGERGDRWGPEGPPDEAYSRVTDAERFAPLHPYARSLADELESAYDVSRAEGDEPAGDALVPAISLTPADPDAAPIVLTLLPFPGVRIHAGRWYRTAAPICGCDACDETAESAIEHLVWVVDCVVRGAFRETLNVPRIAGSAWLGFELGEQAGGRRSRSQQRIDRAAAREMLAGGPDEIMWRPWPTRGRVAE